MIPGKRTKLITQCLVAAVLCFAVVWISACNDHHPSDQQLQQQAAHATEQAKKDAQNAAANARVAAAEAERRLDDIASGLKQGLHNGKDAQGHIDINSASLDELETLPGMTEARAHRVIAHRPYDATHDLVGKGIVTEAEYDRISGRIVAD
ncbi:ComEA family DNA-binding protein [Paracidobacterium acidisoli]|nr:helix-hairpin-helix domain-containing protein [Paracidobacterium acidisoli]MBT9332807.1 helix-hairpin-helix domain-containing protein [Paracidobacterium acidisoli]